MSRYIPTTRKFNAVRVREYLKANPDGARIGEMEAALGVTKGGLTQVIKRMPDVYIDRWVKGAGGHSGGWLAIWCLADIPEHCPHPTGRGAALRTQERRAA